MYCIGRVKIIVLLLLFMVLFYYLAKYYPVLIPEILIYCKFNIPGIAIIMESHTEM